MFALTDTQLVLLAFEPLCVNMNKFASSRGQTSTEALFAFFSKTTVFWNIPWRNFVSDRILKALPYLEVFNLFPILKTWDQKHPSVFAFL